MELNLALLLAIALTLALLVPFYFWAIARGKAKGHTAQTWCKPMGHPDTGVDTGRGPAGRETAGRMAMSDECAHAEPQDD